MPLPAALLLLAAAAAAAVAAAPPAPPRVTWLSPSSPPINPSEPRGSISFPIYSDSLPLGNGALTVSAWANVSAGGISAYIGHQAAMSSHCELFKLALLTVSLSPSPFAAGEAYFEQTLDTASGSVTVLAGGAGPATAAAAIRIYVDANADQVLIDVSSPTGALYSLNATLASTRPPTPVSYAMSFPMCSTVQSQPDVLVDPLPAPALLARRAPQSAAEAVRRPSGARAPSRALRRPQQQQQQGALPSALAPATLVIYHRNVPADWAGNRSEVNATLSQQGLEDLIAVTPDHWQDLQFGLALDGGAAPAAPLARASPATLVSVAPAAAFSLRATVLALQTDSPEEWLGELGAAVAAAAPAPRPAHEAWWAAFWGRSYIQPTVRNGSSVNASLSAAIADKYALTRYVHAIQSRGSIWPLKFNGMAFMAHATGDSGSADYRIWGPSNSYGAMLAAGDFEEQRVILDYYTNAAKVLQPRTQKYWNHSGIWTTETHTLYGVYQQFDYGCKRPDNFPRQYETSGYLAVDQGGNSGTGEWSLMALDFYAATGDAQYLPLAFGAADYFMYHFLGNVSAATGRITVWPAQVLETYWCTFNVTSQAWENCCEDDSPTISGMMTLFEKLLALPPALATPAQRAAWGEFAALRMPALPLTPAGTIAPARVISTGSHNGEGPELFAMHPHRVFTKGREVATGRNLSLAVATYHASAWATYANEGWNYGINAAVLAGITDAAVAALSARALTPPAPGYRFPGFSPQFQDYDPSADHYANFARALQEMVLQGGEDGFENATIVLLPAWPCEWDLAAKLWAPGNTTVELEYASGALVSLVVTPPQRAAAVKWAGCVQN